MTRSEQDQRTEELIDDMNQYMEQLKSFKENAKRTGGSYRSLSIIKAVEEIEFSLKKLKSHLGI